MKPTKEENHDDNNDDDNDDHDKVGSPDVHDQDRLRKDYPDQSHNKENEVVDDDLDDDEDDDDVTHEANHDTTPARKKVGYNTGRTENDLLRFADSILVEEEKETDPEIIAQLELIEKSKPTTDLEIALSIAMKRKTTHLNRLTAEILKLKNFISKRKQTYKRKRKDDGAPTRALSAYNIFIQERFALLAKENEKALKSENEDVTLQRVPPAHLVAATGNVWKSLPIEEKQKYEERYVLT
jgi:deoxyribodipyrimidine photolyase